METLIMHPKNKEQSSALKAFAKALKVDFEAGGTPYDPQFVAKINKSRKQAAEGKVVIYTLDQLETLCK